jgi:hypothetical protein
MTIKRMMETVLGALGYQHRSETNAVIAAWQEEAKMLRHERDRQMRKEAEANDAHAKHFQRLHKVIDNSGMYATDGVIEHGLSCSICTPRPREQVPQAVHDHGWQWRPVGDGAFAPPFGTIRVCIDCGCLVAGGPTRCVRCAKESRS